MATSTKKARPLSPEAQFAADVSKATGLDPRVVLAWVGIEGAYAPGGTGHYNYLNLRPYPGDPYSSVSSGNFEQFSNLHNAEVATIKRLNQPFASNIVKAASGVETPRQQIAAIASTGWDAGHYGGPGGPNLVGAFSSRFGFGALDKPPVNAGGQAYGGGSASDFLSGDLGVGKAARKAGTQGLQDALGVLPGGPVLQQGASALGGPVNAVQDAVNNVKSIAGAVTWIFKKENILRVLEIIAGAVLVLVAVARLTGASKAAGAVASARAVPA